MKRLVALALAALTLLFLLVGCGSSPIRKAQKRAVEIGEQYLNYEITADEAGEALRSILVPEVEGNGDLYLRNDINVLALQITSEIGGRASYEEIADAVKNIKETNYGQ